MKKRITFTIAILLCAALLAGCGCAPTKPQQQHAVYKEGGAGVISLPLTYFDTFNPVLTQSETVLDAMTLVYDSLYRRGADGQMQPLLAAQTEVSADGLTYTVHLRNDVRWHNGDMFSAYDVSYTLAAIAAAESSQLKGCLSGIAAHTAKSNFVYEFTLIEPNSCFIDQLDFPVIRRGTDCTAVQADYVPMGTSAYYYIDTDRSRAHILGKNQNCTTVVAGAIEEIVLKEIPAADNLMYALESREVEAVHVDTKQLRTYSAKGNVTTVPYVNRNFTFLGMKAEGALADKQVRRALSLILDRDAIKTNAMFGRFVPSTLPFVPGSNINPMDETQPAEDAATLLTAAGYAQTSEGTWQTETEEGVQNLSVSILDDADNEVRSAAAEEIAKQFKAFGIGVSIDKTDFETYTMRVDAREYNMFLGETLLATDLDVSAFVGIWARFASPVGQNMDTLLYNARAAVTPEDKETAFLALADAISDEVPVISVGFGQNAVIINDRIDGEICPVYQNIYCDFALWDAA